MTVRDIIDLLEMKLKLKGIEDFNRRFIRDIVKLKYKQFIGLGLAEDGSYTLTTDGQREYELPDAVKRVTFVTVDGAEALKVTPEEADRTYAEETTS
jgi:hypothetical protein